MKWMRSYASVWYNAVIRGDMNRINVGEFSSVGENTVLLTDPSLPTGMQAITDIGRNCTIGADCTLYSLRSTHHHRCLPCQLDVLVGLLWLLNQKVQLEEAKGHSQDSKEDVTEVEVNVSRSAPEQLLKKIGDLSATYTINHV